MRPNLLIICTDQQRFDTIHALNNRNIDTPNLDRLCRDGVAFTNAYCQSPTCCPSRTSMMTGKYPSATLSNFNGNRAYTRLSPLFTATMAERGYIVGLGGKLHLASARNGVEERADDGFCEFYYSHDPWEDTNHSNDYIRFLERNQFDLDDVFKTREDHTYSGIPYYGYQKTFQAEYRQTRWCGDIARDFITRYQGERWCFVCNVFDPHPPFDAPQEMIDKYLERDLPEPVFDEHTLENQRLLSGEFMQDYRNITDTRYNYKERMASYYAAIELIDEEVGRMISCLEETGQLEHTMVVFTSDHGEMLGDHGMFLKGCRFYEGLVKVPLIISYPGHFRAGYCWEMPVELLDLTASINELFELGMDELHGVSLLPVLQHNREESCFRKPFVRAEYYASLRFNEPHQSYGTMIRKGFLKLCIYHGNSYGELYDLERDPQERNNLWDDADYSEVKFRLLKLCFDDCVVKNQSQLSAVGGY